MKFCTGCGGRFCIIKILIPKEVRDLSKLLSNKKDIEHLYRLSENSELDLLEANECDKPLIFCGECGVVLKDDDIKTFEQKHDEGRSETLIGGYKCSSCGFDVDY